VDREASDHKLVGIGRITVLIAMILAILISPFLGIDKKGGFQYIQDYTGFVSPGVFCIFILGFFWKRATATAALTAIVAGFALLRFHIGMVKTLALSAALGIVWKMALPHLIG